jgi:5-formyltetrahydrofolate cyclo-ligase
MLLGMKLSTRDIKKAVRKDTLSRRDAIPLPVRRVKDSAIRDRLLGLPEFINAASVLFYASFRSEVDTNAIMVEALSRGKAVMLPRVEGDVLKIYEIKDRQELSHGYMGIPEPPASDERLRALEEVRMVVMPGVAFDPMGLRLGYGKGYYDRMLEGARDIPLVALAYEEQMSDGLPHEEHDVRVDIIITDKRTIDCRGQEKD